DGVLSDTETRGLDAVVVGRERMARLGRRPPPGLREGVGEAGVFDSYRAGGSAQLAGTATAPRLDLLEVGQHVAIGPAGRSVFAPPFEIVRVAARERHHVDRRRPAQYLAANQMQAAVVQARVGLGAQAPVEHAAF